MAYQRRVLASRRIHRQNLSGTRTEEIARALKVFDKALRTLPLPDSEWSQFGHVPYSCAQP